MDLPVNPKELLKLFPVNNDLLISIVREESANFYQVSEELIQSKSRKLYVIKMRHMAWYIIGILNPKIRLAYLGKVFGNFNHASVIHARSVMDNHMSVEVETQQEYNNIMHRIITRITNGGESLVSKDFFYINLHDAKCIKGPNGKCAVFTGVDDVAIKEMLDRYFYEPETIYKEVKKTGVFILDKNNKSENNKDSNTRI